MRLVFAGTPAAALPSLQALLDSSHEVAAVLTRPEAPAGRGKALRPSPAAEVARTAGIEVLTPPRPSDPALLERLTEIAPDCCPIVAYGGLIPPPVLAVPPRGWVNLHFSLLPAWRGAAPVQHAVLAGDDLTGATTFRLDEGLDTGPVYGFATEPIGSTDTAGDVLERLAASGARLLLATLDGIADGRLVPMAQPAEGVSHAPKLGTADVRVDWAAPALRIDRLTRAATPVPGPWTTYEGRRIKLGPVGAVRSEPLAPGVIRLDRALGVLVGTGTHPVALSSVRPEGKAAMAAADWARGARPAADSAFT